MPRASLVRHFSDVFDCRVVEAVDEIMKMIYRPTVLTLLGVAATIAAVSWTTGYVLGRAPALPPVLAVHFDGEGIADRFVQASYPIVLVPVWIQLTLAIVFGTVAGVLLYRTQTTRSAVEDEMSRQERERMLMAAEAISLLSAIWVSVPGAPRNPTHHDVAEHVLRTRRHLLPEPRRLHRPFGDRGNPGRRLRPASQARRAGDR